MSVEGWFLLWLTGFRCECLHVTLTVCLWVTWTSSKRRGAAVWAQARRAVFGCWLHTSSGMFARWAALQWQAQKNKLGHTMTGKKNNNNRKMPLFLFLMVCQWCHFEYHYFQMLAVLVNICSMCGGSVVFLSLAKFTGEFNDCPPCCWNICQ